MKNRLKNVTAVLKALGSEVMEHNASLQWAHLLHEMIYLYSLALFEKIHGQNGE